MYSEQVRAHYTNPRNAGRIENPSAQAIVRSPADSDTVVITLKIENSVVRDAKFKCVGCPVAIACSSIATEMVIGKHVDVASQITEQIVAEALGGIPDFKMRCSNLAPEAIRNAIAIWRKQQIVSR